MCTFSSKSSKLYLKNIGIELINYKTKGIKENFMFCTPFRYFTKRKFVSYSTFQRLPLKSSSHFLQTGRKNHFRPWAQRYVLKPVNRNKEKEFLHISLIESLQKCKSVEEQTKVFDSIVKLPDEDINRRYSVCQNLEGTLQRYFPSCFVCLVGSSVNGYGFKGCDVDLSIQFQNESINEHSFRENAWLSDELEVNPLSKISSPKSLLQTIKKILQNENYDEPLTIIPGRCPILNFTVQNIPCDLAVNNKSAFHSTNLMLLCGELDTRVLPLMKIIIYWAKHFRLVGGPAKFKTYAIFLMVLYFLQTRSPPVLPSVETMFKKTDFLKNLDNWSYDVKVYLNQFEKSNNKQTVEELLKEFFIFYRSFDFSQIICPINSDSMNKSSFASKIDCSNSFELNTINIQDPLEPCWNVTTGVNWKHCKNFSKSIISVWAKYQDQTCWIPGPQNWGLLSLFHKGSP